MSRLIDQPSASSETADLVVKALEASPEPLKAKQIGEALPRPFRIKPDELQGLLDELVAAQRIEKLPPFQKNDRYWTRSLDDYARLRIRQALDRRPLTRSELKSSVKTALRGVTEKRQGELLRELEGDGRVLKLPPLLGSRTDRFSTRPADPREYVRHALDKLAEKLSKAGIDAAQLRAACREAIDGGSSASPEQPAPGAMRPEEWPHARDRSKAAAASAPASPGALESGDDRQPASSDNELARLVVQRMQAIEPAAARGALVSIAQLRRQPEFAEVDKPTFDRVLLDLGRRERVDLHRHDFPMSLSEEERSRFVLDDRDRYYNGISLRVENPLSRVESRESRVER